MFSFLLFTAAASTVFIPPSPAPNAIGLCDGSTVAPLHVDLTGLKNRDGWLRIELYPATDGDFLKDDRDLLSQGKVFVRIEAKMPAAGAISLCVAPPRPGRYAMVVIHSNDGRPHDRSQKFDVWKDGVGLPLSNHLGRHHPSVSDAMVVAATGGSHVQVRLQYMQGLRGFAPLEG